MVFFAAFDFLSLAISISRRFRQFSSFFTATFGCIRVFTPPVSLIFSLMRFQLSRRDALSATAILSVFSFQPDFAMLIILLLRLFICCRRVSLLVSSFSLFSPFAGFFSVLPSTIIFFVIFAMFVEIRDGFISSIFLLFASLFLDWLAFHGWLFHFGFRRFRSYRYFHYATSVFIMFRFIFFRQ